MSSVNLVQWFDPTPRFAGENPVATPLLASLDFVL
jgi:hypothetical protein